MNFSPKSVTELEEEKKQRMKLLDPGIVDYHVRTAVDKTAQKTGIEMIEMEVEVTDQHGTSKIVTDWLHPSMMTRIRNFCYGNGIGELYERGTLVAEHCVGMSGKCIVMIEKSRDPQYPDKNKIRDYMVNGATKPPASPQPSQPTESSIAMRKAQSAYKAKFPSAPQDELVEGWNQAVRKYFFGKKPELVTAAEWQKFAADGFEKATPQAPFGNEMEFKEEDIPF